MRNINELIDQMTLEEKAAFCTGASDWRTVAIERLGIPSIFVADGPHGVRRVEDETDLFQGSLPATCFPTASCSASSWNRSLLHQMGEAMAEEAQALGVSILLGPGANIKRTPLNGRTFESCSEDPFLSGEMAASLIEGIQKKGVGTSLKHFAVNNQEYQRLFINAVVDERTLREIYLAGFERAVKKANPWTVMCAYNKLNGDYCSEKRELLVGILKDEWGFEGLVVSDWGAVHDRTRSLAGGLDLEMPGPQPHRTAAVVDAVRSGELSMGALNEAVRRILGIVFKAKTLTGRETFDQNAHHQLAREVASEGIVLLKNDGLLPIGDQKRIAVIGRSARETHFQGGGSSHINPTQVDQPLEMLKSHAPEVDWRYAEGYLATDSFDQALIDSAAAEAQSADLALIFVALPPTKESEGYDRKDLKLTAQQMALIQAVAAVQPHVVVILNSGSAIAMAPWMDKVDAILQGWMMGQAGAGALVDILFGEVNPSGKLTETFPFRLEDTPAFINFPGEVGEVRYGEGMYVGYRYYDARQVPVQFPFGFGLSYTTFEYSHPEVPDHFRDVDGLVVSVDVTNTGEVAGKEIVQVYVHDHQASLDRPIKALKGFAKVELAPGETKRVSISLDFRSFAFYHPEYQQWITEDGDFDILIGASSQDIRFALTTTLTSTVELPCVLDMESTIKEWLEDPKGAPVLAPLVAEMRAKIEDASDGDPAIGMSVEEMYMDLPLVSVLAFQSRPFETPPEGIVAALLEQVYAD